MRYAANGWGIQILKNCVMELKPVLKRMGFFVFCVLRLAPYDKKDEGNEISERKNK
jgi:hypothetical protein